MRDGTGKAGRAGAHIILYQQQEGAGMVDYENITDADILRLFRRLNKSGKTAAYSAVEMVSGYDKFQQEQTNARPGKIISFTGRP